MTRHVLLVTAMLGEGKCPRMETRRLNVKFHIVGTRRIALAALRSREYSVLVLDQCMMDSDPVGLELLWQAAGGAIPVEMNLAVSGWTRVLGEVRTALQRRQREQLLAQHAALQLVEGGLRTAVTGLLLRTQLALLDPALSVEVTDRLHEVVSLTMEISRMIKRPEIDENMEILELCHLDEVDIQGAEGPMN